MKYIVRHGSTRFLGEYTPIDSTEYQRMQRVVIQSPRGIETGVVLCETSDRAKEFLIEPTSGKILRLMNTDDLAKERQWIESQKSEFAICQKYIEHYRLQMDLVDVEHLLGGERIVFYFLVRPPEKRVDFRELVRDLAREFHTRIEMRQIGVRDEAKLLADYGDCGKPVCCNTHLTVLPPVSMRMAKVQKSTLDPAKISGRCGRLKCCLRYEFDVYEELQQELPPIGAMVVAKGGKAKVLAQEILSRKLLLMFEDGRRVLLPAMEVITVIHTSPPSSPYQEEEGGSIEEDSQEE